MEPEPTLPPKKLTNSVEPARRRRMPALRQPIHRQPRARRRDVYR